MKFTTQVIKGQGRGKALGYPTFNLKIPPHLSTKPGIYAGWVWIENRQYLGAFHFGSIPVFSDPTPHLEVFVIDYSPNHPTCPPEATGSRNGRIGSLRETALRRRVTSITFQLIKYLRPIRNFKNPAILARHISLDVQKTREVLKLA